MTKMKLGDWKVYGTGDECIFVISSILSVGEAWPEVICHQNHTYVFNSNEIMQDWMIGNYGGHAKYVEVFPG